MTRCSNRRNFWFALVLPAIVAASASPASATIRYKISLNHPELHTFDIKMEIPAAAPGTSIAIPAWNALYQIRDFSYRIHNLHASTDTSPSRPLRLQPLNQQTWQLQPSASDNSGLGGSSLGAEVEYATLWDEPGPFNSQLNAHHAFVNLAEILMYLPDRRTEAVEVVFEDLPADWRVTAELSLGPEKNSFTAASYDALVDAPVEAGNFSEFSFSDGATRFRVVVDAKEPKDVKQDELEQFLRRITTYEIQMMEGAPFEEYAFFLHIGPGDEVSGGGMEHSFSTAIAAASMEGAAAIAAHELFHAWNVKRIRPQALEPVDYTRPQPTRALWFAEGVTSTYAAYTLERSGLWSKQQFYTDLTAQIGELESRPARRWQSVEESSLDAWLEKYDDYNTPDRSISYYNKGQILGVLLDLAIRSATDNRKSLDDVLRLMNTQYAQQGKFYHESDDIQAAVEQISGTSFQDFFRRYVAGVDSISYDSFLADAGLELKFETKKNAALGFTPVVRDQQVIATDVDSGSAAEAAGLHDGDILLQLNGKPIAKSTEPLRQLTPGALAALRIRRGNTEQEISFSVELRDVRKLSIVELPHPTEQQKRIREGILRGSTD